MLNRYTVNDLAEAVNAELHNTGLKIGGNFFRRVDDGRRALIATIEPPELRRSAFLEQALYDQVDKYAVASDLQYNSVQTIKALKSRRSVETMEHPLELVYERRFNQKRHGAKNVFTINYENGIKYMKIFHPRGLRECQHLPINEANSLTENGTWNVGGNIGNLTIDKVDYITGKGALKFDINNSSNTGFIENTTMKAVDIHDYLDTGAVFTWLSISKINSVTAVQIKLGSSPTDYYEFTVNAPHDGNQFLTGWNLLRFVLDEMTMVGFPDVKNITYVRFDITTTGTQAIPQCRLDNVVVRKGVLYQVTYSSAFMFVDPFTGAWKQRPTNGNDLIMAEEDTFSILTKEVAKAIMQSGYGNNDRGVNDITMIKNDLKEMYFQYQRLHKTEAIDSFDSFYIFGDMYSGTSDDPMNSYGNSDDIYGSDW